VVRILMIDQDTALRTTLQELLEEQSYEVIEPLSCLAVHTFSPPSPASSWQGIRGQEPGRDCHVHIFQDIVYRECGRNWDVP